MSTPYIYDTFAQKVADVFRIPLIYVVKLREMGAMDHKIVRDRLIKHDFQMLEKTNKFTRNQIIEKLAGIYDVSTRKITSVIQMQTKKLYFCATCGAQISKQMHIRNDGICDKCFSKSINL